MSDTCVAGREPAYQQHPDVLFTPVSDSETVLLSMPTSCYYTLNQTGSAIWQALRAPATSGLIAQALHAEFEVEPAQALEHAHTFVAELLRRGLICESEPRAE